MLVYVLLALYPVPAVLPVTDWPSADAGPEKRLPCTTLGEVRRKKTSDMFYHG